MCADSIRRKGDMCTNQIPMTSAGGNVRRTLCGSLPGWLCHGTVAACASHEIAVCVANPSRQSAVVHNMISATHHDETNTSCTCRCRNRERQANMCQCYGTCVCTNDNTKHVYRTSQSGLCCISTNDRKACCFGWLRHGFFVAFFVHEPGCRGHDIKQLAH